MEKEELESIIRAMESNIEQKERLMQGWIQQLTDMEKLVQNLMRENEILKELQRRHYANIN